MVRARSWPWTSLYLSFLRTAREASAELRRGVDLESGEVLRLVYPRGSRVDPLKGDKRGRVPSHAD